MCVWLELGPGASKMKFLLPATVRLPQNLASTLSRMLQNTLARFPSPHLRSFSALGFAPQQRPAFSLCWPRGRAVHAEGTRGPALSTIQADSSRPRQQGQHGFQRTGPAPHLPHQAPHACLSRVASVPGLTSRQPNPHFGRCRPSFQSPCGREAWPAPASRGAMRCLEASVLGDTISTVLLERAQGEPWKLWAQKKEISQSTRVIQPCGRQASWPMSAVPTSLPFPALTLAQQLWSPRGLYLELHMGGCPGRAGRRHILIDKCCLVGHILETKDVTNIPVLVSQRILRTQDQYTGMAREMEEASSCQQMLGRGRQSPTSLEPRSASVKTTELEVPCSPCFILASRPPDDLRR